MAITRTLRERVYFKIDKRTCGCWMAPATIEQAGVRYSIRSLVYEWEVGPLEPGLFVVATCRERYCVAPEHLRLSPWRAGEARVGRRRISKPPKVPKPKPPKQTPEEALAQQRMYKQQNRERLRIQCREYYYRNRDRILESQREKRRLRGRSYFQEVLASPRVDEIKAKRAAYNREYKARRRSLPSERILLPVVRERDGDICWLCGMGEVPNDIWTVDHVIPLSRRGPNLYSNVRLAHGRCNSRKHNKLVA